MDTQQLIAQINELFDSQEYDSIKPLLLRYKEITEHNNDLAMVCYLCTIYEHEKAAGQATLFSKVSDINELLGRYTVLKFYLRRIDFDVLDETGEFYRFLMENKISSYELLGVIDFSIVHKENVLQKINGGLILGEETDREHVGDIEYDAVCSADKAESYDTESDGMQNYDAGGSGAENRNVEDHDTRNYDAEKYGSENCETETCGRENAQEICFIICTNNPAYAQECIYYINHLNVPEGITIDVLTVEEAKSLTSAYNEAMQYSHAKYKVYLHHDTFIVYPDLIRDCLDIFRKNPQIGMIGNIGCRTMPATGVMWDADRYGMVYEQHIYETELLVNTFDPELEYLEMDAIDGFIMITQYDIPWREDLFDKWDFYDCSQSMEFRRRGYKVVVPNMRQPWCVHDCGFINLTDYEGEKEKFISEYLAAFDSKKEKRVR